MVQVIQFNREDLREVVKECVEEAIAGMTSTPRPGRVKVKDVDEAADLLGISKPTIYRLVRESREGKGSFPFHKQGGKLMFLEAELLDWVTSNR